MRNMYFNSRDNTSKNKCPRLLLNNSPHYFPLNAATRNVNIHYMKPDIASATVSRPYLKVRNKLVGISQQYLSGGFYWTQVLMVTFLEERK